MSRRALLHAVRGAVWDCLKYDEGSCDFTAPGGRPPDFSGRWFVGVWAGPKRLLDADGYAEKADYGVNLTLTWKVDVPFDRIGKQMCEEGHFYDRADDLDFLMHKDSYDFYLSNAANRLIRPDVLSGQNVVGFRSALRWQSDSQPRLVGSQWFGISKPNVWGVVCDITTGKAIRIKDVAAGAAFDLVE